MGVDAAGGETVVDEFLFSFTHNTRMDWMLPGLAPTGKKGGQQRVSHGVGWDSTTTLG